MIICDECGSVVTWSKQKGRFYGACQRVKSCWTVKYLREDRIEAMVIEKLGEVGDQKGKVLTKLKSTLQIIRPQDIDMYRQKMIDELGRQIHRIRSMKETLYDDRLAGFVSKERYDKKRRQLARQAIEVSERLAMLREAQDMTVAAESVPEYDNPIVELYAKSTPHQKRIIMSVLFKKITYKNGEISLRLSNDALTS